MTATLYTISYSPWSARAEWALNLCGVPFEKREYLPMLGEPMLRARLRDFTGKVSVPAFIDRDVRIVDSRKIAEHAVKVGSSPVSLFPAEDGLELDRWHRLAEKMLESGRALVAWKTAQSEERMLASVPFPTPGPLKPVGRGLAMLGIHFLSEKYDFDPAAAERHRQIIRLGMIALRDALEQREEPFLLGRLSWADIAMASAMQVVNPAPNEVIALSDVLRETWTTPELAEEFSDLEGWREEVFEELRLF
jgi:glutathione S-transferase